MKKIKIEIFLINALLFLLPLIYMKGFGSYNILRYFFFGTITLILAIITTYRFLKNKNIFFSFFKNWYCYGLVIYLLSFLVVSITSIDKTSSFFSSFQRTDGFFSVLFLSLFSLSVYSVVSINGFKVIKQFLISSVLGATILSLFIIFSPNGLGFLNMNWLVESRGGAMLGNSSVAASYVLWNIFFVIILFIKSNNLKQKIFILFSFFVLSLSPLFLNWQVILKAEMYKGLISVIGEARGALLGIIFGLVVSLGVYFLLQNNKFKKYVGLFLVSIASTLATFGVISLLNKTSVLHQKFIENAGEGRFVFWNSAIQGFKDNPFLGIGPGNFSYSFHKFFDTEMLLPENGIEVLVDRTHNLFFETLNGGGLLLILALLFFIFSIIWGLIKLSKEGKLSKIEVSLFVGALMGWLVQAFFVFESINSLILLFLICGIAYGGLVENNKKQNIPLSIYGKIVIWIIFFISILFFTYSVLLPYKKNRVLYKTYNSHLPARVYLWKNLSRISPMGDSYDSVIIFNNIFKTYDKEKQNIRDWDINKKEIVLKELDEIIKHLTRLTNYKNDYNLILINAKICYLRMYISNDISDTLVDKMHKLLNKAILLSPSDPQPYWVKSNLYIEGHNLYEAKNMLEQALILEPRLEYTHSLILKLANDMNDKEYYNFTLNRAKENIKKTND